MCMLSHFSHVRLFVTPWTVAHQAPLSMGFSWQECWSVLPFPPLDRGVSRGQAGGVGWLQCFAHCFGGIECRGHAQSPAFEFSRPQYWSG